MVYDLLNYNDGELEKQYSFTIYEDGLHIPPDRNGKSRYSYGDLVPIMVDGTQMFYDKLMVSDDAIFIRDGDQLKVHKFVQKAGEYGHRSLGYPVYWMDIFGKGKGLLAFERDYKETPTSEPSVKFSFYKVRLLEK